MPSQPKAGQQVLAQVFVDNQVEFDPQAFDDAIRAHGCSFIHWRGMRCPVGLVDQFDIRRPHDDHSGCSNGFIYTIAGKVTCLFTGNNMQPQVQETGVLDGSSVNVTLPRTYDDDGCPLYIAPFDRLYLAEESIVVVDWHLQEVNITGIDKLNHPAVKVQDLMDSRGVRYTEGQDFEVRAGKIVWLEGGARPIVDSDSESGPIYAIRYLYRPYWYVKRFEHEVRVAQVNDDQGIRRTIRMPQSISLIREYVFENEAHDPDAAMPDSARQVKGPRDGQVGPR